MRFEKYYVGNTNKHKGLFHQLRGKEAAPNRVPDGTFNMINETSTNNGITKKAFSEHIFSAPAITVSVNYASTVFMQVEDFCASVNIIILKSDWLCKYNRAGLYIVTLLKKNNQRYDYAYKISKDRLNETIIELPTLDELDSNSPYSDNGYIPDFEYMERYIAELEQERIAELEQYLIATGLNDYTLTDEDKDVLSLHNAEWGNKDRDNAVVDGVRFEEFELGKLFDISTTKGTDKNKIKLSDTGDIEFIGRTSVNWGIQGYTEELSYAPNPKNSFSLVQVGETVALWREREWYASQNIFLLVPKFSEINNTYLYFQGVINKEMTVYGKGYTTYPTLNKLKHTTLYLPIVMNGNSPEIDTTYKYHKDGYIPDFEYMERYIKSMEKVVIADVVKYKDRVIAQTKALVNK